MFILTENGNSINSRYTKSIFTVHVNEYDPYLVKAVGSDGEEYYLARYKRESEARGYILDIMNFINRSIANE